MMMNGETADPFLWTVRVYWEDTDGGGVVYYANYLRYLERARTEWLRARGIDQSLLAEQEAAVFVVRSAHCEFIKPARLDDELQISVAPTRIRNASMELEQTVVRIHDGELLMRAEIKAGCLDAHQWTPRRFPESVAQAMASPSDGHN